MRHFLQSLLLVALTFGLTVFAVPPLIAQNITFSTPQTSVSEGFFFGGGGAIPPFGGYDPNAGGRLSFGGITFNFAKGSTRSSVTQAPSLTVMNGFGGSIASGEYRPFVTGVIPVIGGGNGNFVRPLDNGVTRAINSGMLNDPLLNQRMAAGTQTSSPSPAPANFSNVGSSATTGAPSVSAIKSAREQRLNLQRLSVQAKLDEAQLLIDRQEFAIARTVLREASQLTDDPQTKSDIKQRIAQTRGR